MDHWQREIRVPATISVGRCAARVCVVLLVSVALFSWGKYSLPLAVGAAGMFVMAWALAGV